MKGHLLDPLRAPDMSRRVFMVAVVGGLLAVPLAAEAQPAGKHFRIGFLAAAAASATRFQGFFEAFRKGLAELGYVEGRSIAIESRWAAGKYDLLPGLATELVRLKVDVIVTAAVPAIRAAKEATSTIPIIMAVVVDPVATGLVASLARPGGNISGLSVMTPELVGKQLELLKEIVPKASRVAVLWNPTNQGNPLQLRAAEAAARTLGMRLQALEARTPREIDNAFAAMTKERASAVVVLVDVVFNEQWTRIAELATRRHLPMISALSDTAEAGGLIAYGPSIADGFRRAATYVDKVLKGANPGDPPIEQPTKFDLVINLRTAKALGVSIPPSLQQRANQVIE